MKTIIARFTELKENVSAADSEFDDLDYNDVDTALKSVGISIKDASGQFRDLDDVFLELAEKWDTLDRNTQRYIATTAAGSRQQSRFIAMMSDYDRTLELQATAYESTGQSTVQFNKYQDTVQYKIEQIQNTWEQLRVSLLDQDVYKDALDLGNKLLSGIKKDISIKDLAFIAVIGLTVGKNFVSQFINGMKTNIGTVADVFNKQVTPAFKTAASTAGNSINTGIATVLSKSKIGTKVSSLIFSDNAKKQLEQNLQQATSAFNQQMEKINTQFLELTNRQKNLFSLADQPISAQALTDFYTKLQQVGSVTELTETEVNELYKKMGGTEELTAGTAAYDQFVAKLQQMGVVLQQDITNEENTTTALRQYIQAVREGSASSQQLQQATQNLSNSFGALGPVVNSAASAIKGAFKSSIGSAITSGIITAISTGDFSTALKTTGLTLVTGMISQLVPQFISFLGKQLAAFIPTLIPILSNPAALAAIAIGTVVVVGLGALIYNYYKKNNVWTSLSESLDAEISTMKKNLEDLKEAAETTTSTAKADQQAVSTMESVKKEWDELNNKISLTEDEQERYNELVETINDEYSDTVAYYDEMNNKLIISEDLWNQQLEDAKEIAELSQAIALGTQSNVNAEEYELEKTKNQKAKLQLEGGFYTKTNENGDTTYTTDIYETGTSADFSALQDVINQGLTDYDSISQAINDNYSTAIASGRIAADDNKADEINQMLKLFDDYYKEHGTQGEVDLSYVLQQILDNNQDALEFYQQILDEQEGIDDIINEADEASNQRYIESQRQNYQSNITATVGATQASMVTNTDAADELIELQRLLLEDDQEAIEKTSQYINEEFKSLTNLDPAALSEGSDFMSSLINAEDFSSAAEAVNLSEETLSAITGLTADTFVNMRGDAEHLAKLIRDNTFTQYIENDMQTAAEEIPEQLVDSFAEVSENISTMSLDEYQQSIQKLEGQYGDAYKDNIESAATVDYEQYANMFLTQNEGGQITGGFFSNLFTSEDAATAFTDAIKNGDFEAAGDALRDQGQGMWADLFTQIDPTTISTMSNFIANNVTGDEAQAQAKEKLQTMLTNILNDEDSVLSENELDLILNANVNWDEVNPLNVEETMEDLAEQLMTDSSGALSFNEALEKVKSVFGDINDLVGSFEYGSATAFNTLITSAKEAGETMVTQADTITSIMDEIDTSIGLTREQLNTLDEAGLSDVYELDIDTGKFEIKMEKVQNLFSETIATNEEALKKELGTEQERLNTVTSQIQELDNKIANYKKLGMDTTELEEEKTELLKEQSTLTDQIAERTEEAEKEISLEFQNQVSLLEAIKETIQEAQDAVDEAEKTLKEKQEAYDEAKEAADNAAAVREKAIADAYEEEAKTIKEAEEAAESALKSLQDAYDTLADAQEKLAEAQEDLYEAIHGSADWDSGLERLDSANQMLTGLNTRLKTLKSNMEDASDLDSMVSSTEAYIAAQKEKMNLLEAEKQSTQQSLDNMLSDLYSNDAYANVRDSVQFTVDGRMMLDTSALENADASDAIKDALVKLQAEYNKEVDSMATATEEMEALEDEWENYYTTALKNYISTQDKVVKILKENAQAEIDAVQDKYDNLKEADDDYISALQDAIQKQRDLRDQASQYEELATKEKKLSLMSRDTSGANQKEVATLEDEVENTRQSLLDKEVDNLISSMQEMYETQQKAREEEIEYLNALMETTDWWIQANEIIQGWTDSADAVEWFMSNDSSVQDMSTEAQVQYAQEAETDYTNAISLEAVQQVLADVGGSITDAIQADVDSVNEILTTLNISTEVGNQVLEAGVVARDEAIETAQTAIESAQETVTNAEENLVKMQTAYQEALDDVTTKTQEAAETRAQAVKDAYDTESTTLEALTTAEQDLSTAQADLDTATQNLDEALKGLGTDAATVISGIDEQIRQLQNNCVQYIQDLENQRMSEASERYYVSVNGKDDLESLHSLEASGTPLSNENWFTSEQEAQDFINSNAQYLSSQGKNLSVKHYASGGMVDFTGPAWVDGTKSEPEAFLDPEDTSNIAALAQALRSMNLSTPLVNQTESPISNISSTLNNVTNNSNTSYTGGTVSINLNIESISSDYDVESMLDLMEERINEASNPIGSSVILRK